MINRQAIEERVREWGLREDVVEKDYVLGWVPGHRPDIHIRHLYIKTHFAKQIPNARVLGTDDEDR
jgi:hypothetical protein